MEREHSMAWGEHEESRGHGAWADVGHEVGAGTHG